MNPSGSHAALEADPTPARWLLCTLQKTWRMLWGWTVSEAFRLYLPRRYLQEQGLKKLLESFCLHGWSLPAQKQLRLSLAFTNYQEKKLTVLVYLRLNFSAVYSVLFGWRLMSSLQIFISSFSYSIRVCDPCLAVQKLDILFRLKLLFPGPFG